ncbi:MAG TPA: hypothetical protein VKV15_00305 [Bryobacteraceae bacterium]|nr:hypothetical protein [Bryobacteraceae bacterium]
MFQYVHARSWLEESGKRGRLLSPAWVIEEESGKWLAPCLQEADELAARELLFYTLI